VRLSRVWLWLTEVACAIYRRLRPRKDTPNEWVVEVTRDGSKWVARLDRDAVAGLVEALDKLAHNGIRGAYAVQVRFQFAMLSGTASLSDLTREESSALRRAIAVVAGSGDDQVVLQPATHAVRVIALARDVEAQRDRRPLPK
jgi:hypothetical protein